MTTPGRRLLLVLSALLPLCILSDLRAQSVDVWLGTGNSPLSRGIYHCRLDQQSGRLTNSELAAEISGPGFLAMNPDKSVLYAVGTLNREPSLVAYQIKSSRDAGSLELLNSLPIGDGGAAHVCIDLTGKVAVTAQYGAGSTASFLLNEDGSIARRVSLMKHTGGSGVVPRRQEAPHAHWAGVSPDNRFVFVPDLGLDQVLIYELNADTGELTKHGAASVPPGGGPRHMKFHPNGKWAYVLNELDLSVSHFTYDPQAGTLTAGGTYPALSEEEKDSEIFKSASEIRIHPNGQFLYSANRGHDTITAFSINGDTGALTVIEKEFVRGATPRNFNLDPTARWLLAGGQASHTLAVFSVNQDTGELQYNQSVIHTPTPICVLFGFEGPVTK